MIDSGLPKHTVREPAVSNSRRLSLRRLSAYAGASIVALFLVLAMLIFVFGGTMLDSYGKSAAARALSHLAAERPNPRGKFHILTCSPSTSERLRRCFPMPWGNFRGARSCISLMLAAAIRMLASG